LQRGHFIEKTGEGRRQRKAEENKHTPMLVILRAAGIVYKLKVWQERNRGGANAGERANEKFWKHGLQKRGRNYHLVGKEV